MKPRVLIIDDDQAITQQLRWTLSHDYDVMVANDMGTAVRHARIHEPFLSIIDLHLPPEVDSPQVGLRVLEYIKAHLPESKILVMTGATSAETKKTCYAIGADEFLDKPFDTEHLLATLRRMIPRFSDYA